MNPILLFVLCILADAYLVRILLFDDSTQPFESEKKVVRNSYGLSGPDTHLVGFFDQVRRGFGAYRIEEGENEIEYWYTTVRIQLWQCPKCLSFWLTFLFSGPFIVYTGVWLFAPLVHLALVFCTQFLVFTQLAIEEVA